MEFLTVFAIIFITFAIGFVLLNIRHVVIGQEFRGTCSSDNPMLKNELGECTVCGSKPGECENEKKKEKFKIFR